MDGDSGFMGHRSAKIELPIWVVLGVAVDNRPSDMQLTSLAHC